MSFNQYKSLPIGSGNLNTKVAGTVTAGIGIQLDAVQPGTLSVDADITAATATIQIFVEWQVSDDGTTWRNARGSNNAAAVVVATGTAAIVKVNLAAPDGVYGKKWCRPVVRNEVQAGAAGDLYVLTAKFQGPRF